MDLKGTVGLARSKMCRNLSAVASTIALPPFTSIAYARSGSATVACGVVPARGSQYRSVASQPAVIRYPFSGTHARHLMGPSCCRAATKNRRGPRWVRW